MDWPDQLRRSKQARIGLEQGRGQRKRTFFPHCGSETRCCWYIPLLLVDDAFLSVISMSLPSSESSMTRSSSLSPFSFRAFRRSSSSTLTRVLPADFFWSWPFGHAAPLCWLECGRRRLGLGRLGPGRLLLDCLRWCWSCREAFGGSATRAAAVYPYLTRLVQA